MGVTQFTTGKRIPLIWKRFWFSEEYDHSLDAEASYTLEGGCGAFRRDHFIAMGGFDTLYRPAYWEDVDLSYQAWSRGWTCVYEPRSVIYHRVNGTIGEQAGIVEKLYHRNRCLFVVKNIGGWGFLFGYLCLLPFRVLNARVRNGDRKQVAGVLSAARQIPRALMHRMRTSGKRRLSSRQIRDRILQPLDS